MRKPSIESRKRFDRNNFYSPMKPVDKESCSPVSFGRTKREKEKEKEKFTRGWNFFSRSRRRDDGSSFFSFFSITIDGSFINIDRAF